MEPDEVTTRRLQEIQSQIQALIPSVLDPDVEAAAEDALNRINRQRWVALVAEASWLVSFGATLGCLEGRHRRGW